MPRDDTVMHYSSRTFIYRSYFEHFESTNELFFHQYQYTTNHKKRAQKRSPNNERKEAREKKKKTNNSTTTTTTENVSLDASSVRSPRRERVRGPKRGAVFGTEKLESKCDYVGIRFRARV
jgi:YesN/AraC family two-component response regulator